jgi:hypothetical protein
MNNTLNVSLEAFSQVVIIMLLSLQFLIYL